MLILMHFGAGTSARINPELVQELGILDKLIESNSCVMELAVQIMELLENHFSLNAGIPGANMTIGGLIECDASIMDSDGNQGSIGACPMLINSQIHPNPIRICQKLSTMPPLSCGRISPILLAGQACHEFAMEHGLPMISPQMALSLVTPETKARFERHSAILNDTVTPETKPRLEGHSAILNDTVGVLVLGDNGRMVAASSSSGISLKMAGRVGSAAMVGSGVFIDKSNESAISVTCSGAGETIMKHFLALNICKDEMYLVNNNLDNVGAIGIIDRPDSCSIFYTHSSDCFQIAYKFNHEPLVSGISKTSNSKVVFHQKKFAK